MFRRGDGGVSEETSVASDTKKLEELAQKTKRTVLEHKSDLLSADAPESVEEATRSVVRAIENDQAAENVMEKAQVLVDLEQKGTAAEQESAARVLGMLYSLFSAYSKLAAVGGGGGTQKRARVFAEPSPTPVATLGEREVVAGWVHDMNVIVRRACRRVLTFVGAVQVRMRETDIRMAMTWDPDQSKPIEQRLEVIPPAETVKQFVDQAAERVGPTLVSLFIETTQKKLPELPRGFQFMGAQHQHNPCFDLDELEEAATNARSTPAEEISEQLRELPRLERELLLRDQERRDANLSPQERHQRDGVYNSLLARINAIKNNTLAQDAIKTLLVTDAERQFAPAWAFEVMSSSVFRYFLSTTSIAAFEMALAQVNRIPGCSTFTLKELICSPGVMDQFAFLVSANYLSSGDTLPQQRNGRYGGGGRSANSTYINIMQMRNLLAERVYTCHIWFESVRARSNPLVAEFQRKIDRGPPEWSPLGKRVIEDQVYDTAPGYGPLQPPGHDYEGNNDYETVDNGRRETQELVAQWRERMLKYKKMLPQRELVYRG